MKKSDLRKKYAGLRKKLSSSDIKKLSQDIFNNSEKLNIWDKENFHAFLTIKSKKEIDTSIIVNSLWDKEKNVFVSKSNFDTNTLENYKYSKSTKLKVN
ncbi:MAG: 5-formyltetrahydrofolate cyclo-ligase, partial [Bacteroidota bacterium]